MTQVVQATAVESGEPFLMADVATTTATLPDGRTGELGRVTYIVDGDTIDVELLSTGETKRVRYIGMDTPERGDFYFREATDANAALVEGQTVILIKDVSETDRFGRLLRYIYLQDGTFVNAELVRQGYALPATFPPDVAFQDLCLELQAQARESGVRLWAQSEALAPTMSAPTDFPSTDTPAQPSPLSVFGTCDCSGNLYNCSNFSPRALA